MKKIRYYWLFQNSWRNFEKNENILYIVFSEISIFLKNYGILQVRKQSAAAATVKHEPFMNGTTSVYIEQVENRISVQI